MHVVGRTRLPQPFEHDGDALRAVAAGELAALGAVYDRHYLPVLRFVQRVTAHASDAEDVAQEVFLTAARVAASFDGRSSCRSWLYGIASRLLLHRGRTRSRVFRFLERLAGEQPTPPSTPHDDAMRNELGGELSRALGALSTEKRVVLLLAEVEGLSGEEIARALRIPVNTVWTRLHHARRALRTSLQQGAAP